MAAPGVGAGAGPLTGHPRLDGLLAAIRQSPSPEAARHGQQVPADQIVQQPPAAGQDAAGSQQGQIEGLAVEGHHDLEAGGQAGEFSEHGPFRRRRRQEVLHDVEGTVSPPGQSHQEGQGARAPREPRGLGIQEQQVLRGEPVGRPVRRDPVQRLEPGQRGGRPCLVLAHPDGSAGADTRCQAQSPRIARWRRRGGLPGTLPVEPGQPFAQVHFRTVPGRPRESSARHRGPCDRNRPGLPRRRGNPARRGTPPGGGSRLRRSRRIA